MMSFSPLTPISYMSYIHILYVDSFYIGRASSMVFAPNQSFMSTLGMPLRAKCASYQTLSSNIQLLTT